MRQLVDPYLGGPGCVTNTVDRTLFAGQDMGVVLRVLIDVVYGDLNPSMNLVPGGPNCYAHYVDLTPEWAFCNALTGTYNLSTWLVSDATYVSQVNTHIMPLLQSLISYRQQTNFVPGSQNNCFEVEYAAVNLSSWTTLVVPGNVTIDPSLPPLSFVAPQYFQLPTDVITAIKPCTDTLGCWSGLLCSIARIGASPFILLSNILIQINMAIGTGSGQWTLSNGLWTLLTQLLQAIVGHLMAALLHLLSLVDCLLCAIGGDVPGSFLCQNALYNGFYQLIVAFDAILNTIISFAVDTLQFVVMFFAFLLTLQFQQLGTTISTYVTEFWQDFIEPLFESIAQLLFSELCLCALWNLFSSGCSNAGTCPSKKRGIYDGGLEWPASITYAYQWFAPDWPTISSFAGAWPASHPCSTDMPALAPLALTLGLSSSQANEAAYCLGMVLLFNDTTLLYVTDTCDMIYSAYLNDNVNYNALSVSEQAQAMDCINDRMHLGGAKRGSYGRLNWLPVNTLASSTGTVSMAGNLAALVMDGAAAINVRNQRNKDLLYPSYVLSSSDYQSGLQETYGMRRSLFPHYLHYGDDGRGKEGI
jgi:hypothetical protein